VLLRWQLHITFSAPIFQVLGELNPIMNIPGIPGAISDRFSQRTELTAVLVGNHQWPVALRFALSLSREQATAFSAGR